MEESINVNQKNTSIAKTPIFKSTKKASERSDTNTEKRVDKRKQKFPTRQTKLLKEAVRFEESEQDMSPKLQEKALLALAEIAEQKERSEAALEQKEGKNTEVIPRRSSRPVKKKKMFDELDEPEAKPKLKKKKVKTSEKINTPKKKITSSNKQKQSENSVEISENGKSKATRTNKNRIGVKSGNLNSANVKQQLVYVCNIKQETDVKEELTDDNVPKDITEEEIVEEKETDVVEGDTHGEDKSDKENKDIVPQKTDMSVQCTTCKKTLSNCKALRRHEMTFHVENEDTFTCIECDAVLRSKRALARHKLLHLKNNYTCYECGRWFVSLSSIKAHVKVAHEGMLPFKCSYDKCDKSFSNTSNRKKHIEAVHLNVRKHFCNYCPKVFKNSSAQRVHMHSCHREQFENLPRFECSTCQKVFGSKLKLKLHESVHTAVRPYKCSFEDCSKTFRLKSNMLKHERVHANIRPYVCNSCGQSFSRRIYLETHQYKHTGIKNFQCPVCQKMFSQKGNLNIHMKIHSDERNFVKCEDCGKSFSNKSNLTKHRLVICSNAQKSKSHEPQRNRKTNEDSETILIHPIEDGGSNPISFILREVNDMETSDTVVIIQDENGEATVDKACGTDEIRDVDTVDKNSQNKVRTVYKQGTVNDKVTLKSLQKTQIRSSTENLTNSVLNPHIVGQVCHVGETIGTQTIYVEEPTDINNAGDGSNAVIEEQVIGDIEEQVHVLTSPGNTPVTSGTLSEMVSILPHTAENVEYEIVSSGLDGIEEGILREFLSKWNQQGTAAGATVILDIQNKDRANVVGVDGATGRDSVQYIVTVKDQE